MKSLSEMTLPFCLQAAKRHRVVTSVLVLGAAALLADGSAHGQVSQMIAYLTGVVVCMVAIDAVLAFRTVPYEPLPVRHPRMELIVATILFLVAGVWLVGRYSSSYHPSRFFALVGLLGFLSVFQIALALFLLVCRYSPGDL